MQHSSLQSIITAEQTKELSMHTNWFPLNFSSRLPALAQRGIYTLLGTELPFAFSADVDSFSPSGFSVGGLLWTSFHHPGSPNSCAPERKNKGLPTERQPATVLHHVEVFFLWWERGKQGLDPQSQAVLPSWTECFCQWYWHTLTELLPKHFFGPLEAGSCI